MPADDDETTGAIKITFSTPARRSPPQPRRVVVSGVESTPLVAPASTTTSPASHRVAIHPGTPPVRPPVVARYTASIQKKLHHTLRTLAPRGTVAARTLAVVVETFVVIIATWTQSVGE